MLMTKSYSFLPGAELQTHKNPKKYVLRDRDLTGKYEKGVFLTNKISHTGFSVVPNPNLKSDFKNFFIIFHGGLGFKKPGLEHEK